MALLVSTSFAAEPDLRAKFAWRQPIAGGEEAGALYRIRTPPEVFDGCRCFPSDLRIMDAAGTQWPFYVVTPEGESVVETVPSKGVNASRVEQRDRYVRQDLVIPADAESGRRLEHNRVIVRTPGSDFVRRVEVYGSENQADWGLLGTGYLVDHSRDVRVCNKTVSYPVSTFPFLQVRVYPNAQNAQERLAVDGVVVANSAEKPGEFEDVRLKEVDVGEKDLKEGCQVLVFDVEARNRPVERLVLTSRGEYARSLRIYGRNEETNVWRWVADAEVHKLGESVRDSVALKGSAFRYLKLELFHYDDKPLSGLTIKAQAVPRYLVVESQGGPASLYYGAPDVESPRYDLSRRRGGEEAAAAPFLRLRERADNQFRRVSGFGRYGPWLAAIAVGLVSLWVLRIIVNMMKRQGGERS